MPFSGAFCADISRHGRYPPKSRAADAENNSMTHELFSGRPSLSGRIHAKWQRIPHPLPFLYSFFCGSPVQGELIGLMAQRRQIFQDSLTGRQAVRAVLTHGAQSGKRALYRSRSFSRSAVKAAKASLSPVNLYLFSAAGNVPALTSAM